MNTAMEFLLLSMLSYGDFSEEDYGKTLEELLFGDEKSRERIVNNEGILLTKDNYHLLFDYFKEFLRAWEIFHVDNRTVTGKNFYSKASGFYAVTFRKKDKFVISYRGSESYPVEDAYRDFIETDLLIGMGKRPKQFEDGIEVYETIARSEEVEIENISITGHSLGGGIAQFVAVMADKEGYTIPYTCTWNAVGINKSGIIGVDDFIDFEEMLRGIYPFSEREMGYLAQMKDMFMSFLFRELKKMGCIKDRETIKLKENELVEFNITDAFIDDFIKYIKFDKYIISFDMSTRRELFRDHNFVRKLFQIPEFSKWLLEAKEFIKKMKENKAYEDVIVNFCHSKDMTTSLFKHIGSVYLVDQDFIKKDVKRRSFFKNFFILTKYVKEYHFEDVFLPYLITEGEKRGRFSNNLNIDFIASSVRKLIYLEDYVANDLLVKYYSLEQSEGDEERVKELIINGMKNSKDELIYKEQLLLSLEKLEKAEVKVLWDKVIEKMVSPYKPKDIYDTAIYS
ncbi:hypothetical protein [Ilyobacter sp.]|uniref:hypothetical protein n=1 Tax=Ilyobacter sp. TaxID=3100343 RepID=UPI003569CC02